jgi:hypothetical protein
LQAQIATILLQVVLLAFQQTNAKLQLWFRHWILALAKFQTLPVMMAFLALLTLVMRILEPAAMSSLLPTLNALFHAKSMHNAQNGQLITTSSATANLQFATQSSEHVLQKMTIRPTARNASLLVILVLTAILLLVFGLETNINVNTLQRIVTTENLAPLILVMQKLEVAFISTTAPQINATPTLIVLLGDKQINYLPSV